MRPMSLDADAAYLVLKARDARFDGRLFVGVTSTGVYCRPVCRVRTPRRENCRFFDTRAQAEAAAAGPTRFEQCVASIEADDGRSRLERQKAATRLRQWTDHRTGMVHLAGLKARDLCCVDVDAGHNVPGLCEAGTGHQSDVASTKYRDLH